MNWKLVLAIILAAFIFITAYSVHLATKKMKCMNRYTEVKKGMREVEALDILGRDYNNMEILPNYTKYTWTIKNGSYSGIRNVVLEVKDGRVLKVTGTK